jgi:hypothetical protein
MRAILFSCEVLRIHNPAYRQADASARKGGGPPPNVKKDFTKEVFGHPLVKDEAQQPPVHPHAMSREECSHGRLIALSDLPDQRFVGRTVACRCLCTNGE